MENATFAAGCFWGVETAFARLKGVLGTEVGYSGGSFKNPTYEEVCTGRTGHVESVRISFNPSVIAYEELLKTFFDIHDPTTPNRQGLDTGSQYRSIIFYHNESQKEKALKFKEELQAAGRYERDIVTEIIPASDFYRAEEYHQRYFERRGNRLG